MRASSDCITATRTWDALEAGDYVLAERINAEIPINWKELIGFHPRCTRAFTETCPSCLNGSWTIGANMGQRDQDYGGTPLAAPIVHRNKRIIRTLVQRGADTSRAMLIAERGLAGGFEDVPPPEAYREIIELLRALSVN